MTNLYEAFNQWASRPPDERFWSIDEMLVASKATFDRACESTIPAKELRVVADGTEVKLVGQSSRGSRLSNWAFKVLATKAGAPGQYLRELPAKTAAECLNFGFERLRQSNRALELLFHQLNDENGQPPLPHIPNNNPLLLRAITSEKYKRIWNWEVVEELRELIDKGWRVPPARPAFRDQPGTRQATEADVLNNRGFSLSINVGDLIAPAGLYASAHDMFAFLILEDVRIDDGSDDGCSRGIFVENSEVGDKSLKYTTFLYRHVCGNHIVWDVGNVKRTKIRHVGNARSKFRNIFSDLKKIATASGKRDEERIRKAMTSIIADTPDSTLDKVFNKLRGNIPRFQLEQAYDLAAEYEGDKVDPRSVWGMTQGITRLSQETPFADERNRLDRAAGKVLRIAF